MSRILEFKTYRHFEIKPDYIGYCATHEDYDGPEDRRHFTSQSPTDPEEDLLYQIDMYYEDEKDKVFTQLVGLLEMLLTREDMPSIVKTAIKTSWRYHDALDILDQSRGTLKTDATEALGEYTSR